LVQARLDGAVQLAGGGVDGLFDGAGAAFDRHRLRTFDTRLQHAALVVLSGLAAVDIVEVNFDPRDGIGHVPELMLEVGLQALGKPWRTGDVLVAIELDLHDSPPWWMRESSLAKYADR